MLFKIARNNVKRSYKDYGIYFITLTLAVCIFYSFNSIETQSTMLSLGKSTGAFMETLSTFLAGTSIFVSIILAGLITYANHFLIKKRKKELGIYMTLGMPKTSISKILFLETLLIGLISLIAGILLGIIVSQGLSEITGRLLGVSLEGYRFTVSPEAALKSAAYFGIIFFLVVILNQLTIRRYKLIDLLNAGKKNEEMKLKSMASSIVLFVLSLVMLITAYILVLKIGLLTESVLIAVSILLGVFGTLLFFFSLSSFFIHWVQRQKGLYLKSLRIFVLRQVHNKINSNFLSMSAICLMLFLTITLLFTMFGYKGSYDRMIEGNISFDASGWLLDENNEGQYDMEGYLDTIGFSFDETEKHSFFSIYELPVTTEDLLKSYATEEEWKDMQKDYMDGEISAVKLSDYNEIEKLRNQEPVVLEKNEVLLVSNYGHLNSALNEFMKKEHTVTIEGAVYEIINDEPVKENIMTTATVLDFFYFIVPDDVPGAMTRLSTGYNAVFSEDTYEQSEEKFMGLSEDYETFRYIDDKLVLAFGNTIDEVHARVYGATTLIVFLGVYLGIVFLLSSAAVLALQQLSDANESVERYRTLKKIGATEKLISQAILFQNAIYFGVPLLLAVIHSAVGMIAVNVIFRNYTQGIVGSSLLLIGAALTVIYGGYFYTTYTGFKNIIKARE